MGIWPWSRRKPSPIAGSTGTQAGRQAPSLDGPGGGTAEVAAEPPPDQSIAAQIQRVRALVRKEAAEISRRDEEAVADARRRVEKADRLLRDTGVDEALLALLAEVWHWPSWSTRDDFARFQHIDLTFIEGGVEKRGQETVKTVAFEGEGSRWALEFVSGHHSFGGLSSWGRLSLDRDGQRVCTIETHQVDGAEYDQWRMTDPSLLVPGDWMAIVVEWHERIRAAKERAYQRLQDDRHERLAAGLPD